MSPTCLSTSKNTKWMVFEQQPCQAYLNFSLVFDDEVIERVSQYKYLGTVFNGNMNFNAHVDYILIKAEKSAFMFWKYTERFKISISEKINLFQVLVMSVLFSTLKFDIRGSQQKDMERLDAFYIKHLK